MTQKGNERGNNGRLDDLNEMSCKDLSIDLSTEMK